jgi:hypothetical protein
VFRGSSRFFPSPDAALGDVDGAARRPYLAFVFILFIRG